MKRIFILTALLILCNCAHTGDSGTTTSSAQTCRTYATSITDTTNSVTYSCTLSGTTTVTCTNGGSEKITYTYSSQKAFVDEAASPLAVFSKMTASSLVIDSATATRKHNLTYTFNGAGQWSGTTDVSNGGSVTTSITYTAWDADNRPTAGTASFTAGATCTGRALTIVYVDGSTRTRTTSATGGTGANCSLLNIPQTQMDANGNPTLAFNNNYTINSTDKACY